MTDHLTVTVTPKHQLAVGSQDKNFIEFVIRASKDAELYARIDIPCQKATSGETFLFGDENLAQLHLKFECTPEGRIEGESHISEDGKLSWIAEGFSLGAKEVTIKFTGFNPERSGEASVTLEIWDAPAPKPRLYSQKIMVKVQSAAAGKVAVINFDARPHNVFSEDKVEISSDTIGAKTVKLFGGETEVLNGREVGGNGGLLHKTWVQYPKWTTQYRLEAWRDQAGSNKAEGQFAERKVLVTVEPRPGWGPRDLLKNSLKEDVQGEHFYPTLLLADKDLSAGTPDKKLYGIFMFAREKEKTKRAELWSSDSGVDNWLNSRAIVPAGMGESPGVMYRERLWLIGGSSANPAGPHSNRLCWYYKNKFEEWKTDKREELVEEGKLFTPRMGHACAVFNDRVWVLGGLSQDGLPLDDVWSCFIPEKAENFDPVWKKCNTPLPSGRCMSAVAVTSSRGTAKERLWLYGGTAHPDNFEETFDELWWTEDASVWENLKLPEEEQTTMNAEQRATQGATLLFGSDGYLHLVRKFRSGAATSSDAALLEWVGVTPHWQKEERKFPWLTDPPSGLFLMRSVSFRQRWIFWPVYQYMDRMTYTGKATNYETMIFNAPKLK